MALTLAQKEARLKRLEDRFEEPMLFFALLMIPTIILEQAGLGQPWENIAVVMNWSIWLAFAIELIVMVYAAPRRFRWIVTHPLEVAIVLLTPPFFSKSIESARLLRLLRLTRLIRAHKLMLQIFSVRGLYYAAFAAASITVAGGFAFTIAEKGQHLSPWDGVYWALTTVSTIGSNIEPHTELGRVLSLVVLFAGTGFVAMLTASFAQKFVEAERERKGSLTHGEKKILKQLETINKRISRLEK